MQTTALFKSLCLTFYLQACVLSGLPKQRKLMGIFRKCRQFTEKIPNPSTLEELSICNLIPFSMHAHILSKIECN